ncbi:hypothetical protein AA309_19995 [Microvirga vignae]|uniref:Uncharacterized protein n=2 Tax=Microvirga vignae TaxID=1225564 RepID=A0A0H1R980_9HYPH|nr:hypothetical protein AA309_19995 [Microvirga vignae]
MGSIEDVFAKALQLLQDNEPRQARDVLDTFLSTDECDFTYFADEDDDETTGPSAEDHALASKLAEEAINLIDTGLLLDAARRIECFCSPKYSSQAQCQEAYDEAMTAPLLVFVPPPSPAFIQTTFQI